MQSSKSATSRTVDFVGRREKQGEGTGGMVSFMFEVKSSIAVSLGVLTRS